MAYDQQANAAIIVEQPHNANCYEFKTVQDIDAFAVAEFDSQYSEDIDDYFKVYYTNKTPNAEGKRECYDDFKNIEERISNYNCSNELKKYDNLPDLANYDKLNDLLCKNQDDEKFYTAFMNNLKEAACMLPLAINSILYWLNPEHREGSGVGALVYAAREMRKPSVEEQMKQARNTYNNKSYASHR
ncbi:hypothetical protein L1887_49571 [Cichorium endivia]|nr:hypothetical protein L1887_49571 [Cichorium endivia]